MLIVQCPLKGVIIRGCSLLGVIRWILNIRGCSLEGEFIVHRLNKEEIYCFSPNEFVEMCKC